MSAMDKEISAHEMHERWEILPHTSTGVKKVLKSACAFKRKRDPDGSLNKCKERIFHHGGMK